VPQHGVIGYMHGRQSPRSMRDSAQDRVGSFCGQSAREREERRLHCAPHCQGWAATALPEPGQRPGGASVAPLLDAIAERVPPPSGDPSAPFALLVAMVEHDAFLGPVATGRVAAGTAAIGDRVRVLHHAGEASSRHFFHPGSCSLS
jgi:hypothetical protein